MFTGLVQSLGTLKGRQNSGGAGKLRIHPEQPLESPLRGESVAVNGACLTLEGTESDGTLVFHALAETFSRTNLGLLPIGAKVNLERALRPIDRLGGHFVTGHIDTTARLLSLVRQGDDVVLTLETPAELLPYLVPKGSIAIDGISLTLVNVSETAFTVHLIPTTLKDTALSERRVGSVLNLEGDLLAKYVVRQLEGSPSVVKSALTLDTLLNAGWKA